MEKTKFTLVIVDKNPNVRGFLKREMEKEGYRIHTVEKGREALKWIYDQNNIDLIVVDPDLPDTDKCMVIASMRNRLPPLPTVIHTFASIYRECMDCKLISEEMIFVEKSGDSIERLKQVVSSLLIQRRTHQWII